MLASSRLPAFVAKVTNHVTQHNLRPATMSQSDIYTILCVVDKGDVSFSVKIDKTEIIGELKKQIIKETPSYANTDPASLDLYLVDIPDAQKAELKASVETQVLDSPQLPSRSLVDIFPDGPQPHKVHFIVKASKLHE
jgi:Crinkler effector protein N-terminal domain